MVSDDTYKARTVAQLYREGAYPPNWMAVDDLADEIAAPGRQGSAYSAIERTALDSLSPVEFAPGTGRSAVRFEQGSRGQVNTRAQDWIERHDRSELPFGLR